MGGLFSSPPTGRSRIPQPVENLDMQEQSIVQGKFRAYIIAKVALNKLNNKHGELWKIVYDGGFQSEKNFIIVPKGDSRKEVTFSLGSDDYPYEPNDVRLDLRSLEDIRLREDPDPNKQGGKRKSKSKTKSKSKKTKKRRA
jgi:hypothetical protein